MFFIFTLHFYFCLTCCICEIQYSDLWVDVHSMKTLRVIKEGLNISNWAPVQNALPLRETCAIKTSLNLQPSISLAQQGQKLKVKNNSCSPERRERKQGEEKAKALTGQRKEGRRQRWTKRKKWWTRRSSERKGQQSEVKVNAAISTVRGRGGVDNLVVLLFPLYSIFRFSFSSHYPASANVFLLMSSNTDTKHCKPRWTHSVPACTAVRLRLKRQQHDAGHLQDHNSITGAHTQTQHNRCKYVYFHE